MDRKEVKLRARDVLEDLGYCISELRDDLPEQEWRVKWIAICTLGRAVGHVLKNDGDRLDIVKMTNDLYREIRNEKIFSEFIELDRNLILKEYKFRAAREPLGLGILTEAGDRLVTEQDYNVLKGTYFEDHLPKQAAQEVYDWWDAKLKQIENQLID